MFSVYLSVYVFSPSKDRLKSLSFGEIVTLSALMVYIILKSLALWRVEFLKMGNISSIVFPWVVSSTHIISSRFSPLLIFFPLKYISSVGYVISVESAAGADAVFLLSEIHPIIVKGISMTLTIPDNIKRPDPTFVNRLFILSFFILFSLFLLLHR